MLGRRRHTQEEEVVIRVFQPGQTHHMRAALNEHGFMGCSRLVIVAISFIVVVALFIVMMISIVFTVVARDLTHVAW